MGLRLCARARVLIGAAACWAQANGRKGYLSTALQAGGTELHIFASSLLPAQSW